MFRLYYSIFWLKPPVESHLHEGTLSMKIPMVVLSFGAVLAGLIPFGRFVTADGNALAPEFHLSHALAPLALAFAGIALAHTFYKKPHPGPGRFTAAIGGGYSAARKKFYIDEIYLFITQRIIFPFVGRPAAWIDKHIVDGFMNGLAGVTQQTSALIRGWQSGRVQDYAIYFFAGVLCVAALFLYYIH